MSAETPAFLPDEVGRVPVEVAPIQLDLRGMDWQPGVWMGGQDGSPLVQPARARLIELRVAAAVPVPRPMTLWQRWLTVSARSILLLIGPFVLMLKGCGV